MPLRFHYDNDSNVLGNTRDFMGVKRINRIALLGQMFYEHTVRWWSRERQGRHAGFVKYLRFQHSERLGMRGGIEPRREGSSRVYIERNCQRDLQQLIMS